MKTAIAAAAWIGLVTLVFGFATDPAAAQQNFNPFAGSLMPGGAGSGGSGGRTDAPDVPDAGEGLWEIVIGACAGGAFLGAYSAANRTAPPAATGVGAGGTDTAVVSAAAIGCGLGMATAAVSLGAVRGWQSLRSQ